jgi:hypothetical protein
MSPLAVELVRRLSWFALVLALVLLAVPAALTALGLWGPTVLDQIGGAEQALATARAYGSSATEASYRAAQGEIEEARALASKGDRWRARQAARRAVRDAIEAQRVALAAREGGRKEAALAALEIDRRMNDLEDLYAEVAGGADKETARSLLSMMKDARRRGAGVLLAVEEGDYARAVGQEGAARATLDAARQRLEAERKPGGVSVTRPDAAPTPPAAVPPRSR